MTEMMSAKLREIDNGFILEMDGYIGEKEIACDSMQAVAKELLEFYREHSDTWTKERVENGRVVKETKQ